MKKKDRTLVYPVILSGGSGSRLWPLSRKESPKQFMKLMGCNNLFQDTCLRYHNPNLFEKPIIIANNDHRFQVAESLRQIDITATRIILEPFAKNTAPAIALAAQEAIRNNKDAILLVTPSDHHIKNNEEVTNAIQYLVTSNEIIDNIIVFGIQPIRPETGFGYIQSKSSNNNLSLVKRFTEKPSQDKVEEFLLGGDYFWNSGFFCFRAETFLKAYESVDTVSHDLVKESYAKSKEDLDFLRPDGNIFNGVRSESIDYALLERINNIYMMKLFDIEWNDVGSWDALYDLAEKDSSGNFKQGDIYTHNTQNCYLRSHDRLLATVGVKDLVIVETADSVLVSNRMDTQNIKKIVEQLELDERKELIKHKKQYAPWGYSYLLGSGEGFIINQLLIYPYKKIARQVHMHKVKYFIVLVGSCKVEIQDEFHDLQSGNVLKVNSESIYQVSSTSPEDTIALEVQTGRMVLENDVERFF